VTKAQLRARYLEERRVWESGERYSNEHLLRLDELLSEYFGMPPAKWSEEDPDLGP
jgi:hypothetical protein